jgi:hypothetical protein
MTRTTIINHKKYTVEGVFNMVLNYEFTDKHGAIHLVDGEDVLNWNIQENNQESSNIDDAIAYAKYYANESEDSKFWWKVK